MDNRVRPGPPGQARPDGHSSVESLCVTLSPDLELQRLLTTFNAFQPNSRSDAPSAGPDRVRLLARPPGEPSPNPPAVAGTLEQRVEEPRLRLPVFQPAGPP